MPLFETLSQLYDYVEVETMREISFEIQKVTADELDKQVEDTVYRDAWMGGDDFYKHTFSLLDTAFPEVSTIGNSASGKGFFIETFLMPRNKYFSYYPVGQEKDVTDDIVRFLNDGHGGFYKGKTVRYEGKQFFEKASKELTKGGKLKKAITNKLKSLGYIISRRRTD